MTLPSAPGVGLTFPPTVPSSDASGLPRLASRPILPSPGVSRPGGSWDQTRVNSEGHAGDNTEGHNWGSHAWEGRSPRSVSRPLVLHTEGHRFKSCTAHHFSIRGPSSCLSALLLHVHAHQSSTNEQERQADADQPAESGQRFPERSRTCWPDESLRTARGPTGRSVYAAECVTALFYLGLTAAAASRGC